MKRKRLHRPKPNKIQAEVKKGADKLQEMLLSSEKWLVVKIK